MGPGCMNHWNRTRAEKSYLLNEAAPDFRHKGRILQALLTDIYDLASWWAKLSEAVIGWIEYAIDVDVPVYQEVLS